MTDLLRTLMLIGMLAVLVPESSHAARFTYEPVSDQDDGVLVDGSSWDWLPLEGTVSDLLLQLGQEGGSTYDNSLAFGLPDLAEGQTVTDVRLRLNEQGGTIGAGLLVEITAALDLDPLSSVGLARFQLPRTTSNVIWSIPAAWDSSGQHITKYEETPNLAPIINEVLAQPGWDTSSKALVLFLELFSAAGDNVVRYDDTHGQFIGGNAGIRPVRLVVSEGFRDAFYGKELLCRPKPTSMQVNIVPHADADAYVEWGTDGVSFPNLTSTQNVPAGTAFEFTLPLLSPDTQYQYRLRTRPTGGGAYETGPTRKFVTLPLPGTEARIVATSDMHVTNQLALGINSAMDLLETALAYIPDHLAPDRYHVWLDLGDLVVVRAQRISFDQEEVEQRYRTAREYVDLAAHSLPFVFVRGNHEEVNGWDYDGGSDNTAIWSGRMLLKYFPPPMPDEFFEGNSVPFPDLGLPGDYFAFNVGNLRIRALDPFLFSTARPHNGHGEVGGSLDGWDWELGDQQYLWLREDFVQNPSPFSLLAMHHLCSCYVGLGEYYGRGGAEIAQFSLAGRPTFEWGGQDSTGANVLATKRPGYVHGAVHDVLVNNGNQVVLKGHDHFHGRQELQGMIYVTMAKPDDTGEHTGDLWGWRFSTFYPVASTLFEANSGFYSIVVSDSIATYDYVQTFPTSGIGTVRESFTVNAAEDVTDVTVHSPSGFGRTWIRNVSPNPARIAPRIEFELGRSGPVNLSVYDATGRLVREILSEERSEGLHDVYWDAKDRNGRRVASGIYFAKLRTFDHLDSVKLIVLR